MHGAGRIARTGLFFAATLASPALAGASDTAAAIERASARVDGAGAALQTAREAPGNRVLALGSAVESYVAALAALRAGLIAARAREQALALGFAARRDEIARLVAVLEAVSRTPPQAATLHPEGPLGAARAAAMTARLTPALGDEASELARALAEVEAIRRLDARARDELEAGLATLADAQGELVAAMTAAAPDEPVGPALTIVARDSETLTDLAAALAAVPGAPPAPTAGPTEPMAWPVEGGVLRGFGQPDAAGVRRPGIVLGALPLSLVRAPADATVRYAGPFLEYGYVVVLEPDPQTMVVLAGLAQLGTRSGAAVRSGEPIGMLGGRPLDVEEYVMLPQADTGAGGGETLYIEVRRGRGPVDPEPLFARKG